MKKSIFREQEQPTIFGPRAATVDALADRQNILAKREAIQRREEMSGRIRGIPGLIDMAPSANPMDNDVYAQGLRQYLSGNVQGAVDSWTTVPHHTEARRGLQRIYQELQRANGGGQ